MAMGGGLRTNTRGETARTLIRHAVANEDQHPLPGLTEICGLMAIVRDAFVQQHHCRREGVTTADNIAAREARKNRPSTPHVHTLCLDQYHLGKRPRKLNPACANVRLSVSIRTRVMRKLVKALQQWPRTPSGRQDV